MGRRGIQVRSDAGLTRGGIDIALERFCRLGPCLGSADLDDRNLVAARFTATIEEAGRRMLEAHMNTHPAPTLWN